MRALAAFGEFFAAVSAGLSALLAAVSAALLVAGVVASKLALVYLAIGVSSVALLTLLTGALLNRQRFFGQPESAGPASEAASAPPPPVAARQQVTTSTIPFAPAEASHRRAAGSSRVVSSSLGWPATVSAGSGTDAPGRAGPGPGQRPGSQPGGWPGSQPGGQRPVLPAAGRFATSATAYTQPAYSPPNRSAGPSTPASGPGGTSGADASPGAPQAAPAAGTTATSAGPAEPEVSREDSTSGPGDAAAAGAPPAADSSPAADPVPVLTTPPPDPVLTTPPPDPAPVLTTPPPDPAPAASTPAPDEATGSVVALAQQQREVTIVPGVPRYHATQCILIRFMSDDDLERMPLHQAKQAGCTPCRACLPEDD